MQQGPLSDNAGGTFVRISQAVVYSRALRQSEQTLRIYEILCSKSVWSDQRVWDCPITARALGTLTQAKKPTVYKTLKILTDVGIARQLSATKIRVLGPTGISWAHMFTLWPSHLFAKQQSTLIDMVQAGVVPEEVASALLDPMSEPWEKCNSTASKLFRAQVTVLAGSALSDGIVSPVPTAETEPESSLPGCTKTPLFVYGGRLEKGTKRHVCDAPLRELRSPRKRFSDYSTDSRLPEEREPAGSVDPIQEGSKMDETTKKLAEGLKKAKEKETKARKRGEIKKPVLELMTPRKTPTRAPQALEEASAGTWSEAMWLRFVIRCSMRANDSRVPLWFDDAQNHAVTTSRIYGAKTHAEFTRLKPLTAPLMKFVSLLTEALFEKDTPDGRVRVAQFFREKLISRWESFRLGYLGANASASNVPFNPTYLTRALSKVVQFYRERETITPPPLTPHVSIDNDTPMEWT